MREYGLVNAKLKLLDIIILAIFFFLIFIVETAQFEDGEIMVLIFSSFTILSTPIANRLKNIYFSIIWIVLSAGQFYLFDSYKALSILPLISLVYYHLIRALYYLKYDRNPITLLISIFMSDWGKYNKLEKRNVEKEDLVFTFISFIGYLIITALLAINSIA